MGIENNHIFADSQRIIKNLSSLNNFFSGKKILITGAAGFLGSQFLHYFLYLNDKSLLEKNCEVFASDLFFKGIPDWLSHFNRRKDLNIKKSDINSEKNFPKVDYIIHLATIASPKYYRKYPIETMDANVFGLRNLLEHSLKNPISGFLYFSTSEIYGDPDSLNIPTKEDYRGNVSCTGPRACYDESKRFGETLCINFSNVHSIPIKIVRPFNNYGPGLGINDGRVVPDFFSNVISDDSIVLYSDGKPTRTFCYISDAIEGYLRALLLGKPAEPYNIGSESPEISIFNLAKEIIKVSGKDLDVILEKSSDSNYLTDNPNRRCPSIAKARLDLDFNPKVVLSEGLMYTYKYYVAISN